MTGPCCEFHDLETSCGRVDVCCADCPTPAGPDPDGQDITVGKPPMGLDEHRVQQLRQMLAADPDRFAANGTYMTSVLRELDRIGGERDRLTAALAAAQELLAAGDASDGHHTHNELYEYRLLYNAAAVTAWAAAGTYPVVKSWKHSDGEECFGGGWFIVVATLPTGQVSNHYQAEHWDLFRVPEVQLPPEYDGHTPAEASNRLRAALAGEGAADQPQDSSADAQTVVAGDAAAESAVSGVLSEDGPYCYGHPPVGSGHGLHLAHGWPAHRWSGQASGECQQCGESVESGDLYLCGQDAHGEHNGIVHAGCPVREVTEADLRAALAGKGTAELKETR